MFECKRWLIMPPEEYQGHRGRGTISASTLYDYGRMPLCVGSYKGKPVFIYKDDAEKELLITGDIEGYYAKRGVKDFLATVPPDGLGTIPRKKNPANPNGC